MVKLWDEHHEHTDALLLVKAQEQRIETVGQPRPNSSWQTKTGEAYAVEQFAIDWENKQVTCPPGKTTRPWKNMFEPQAPLTYFLGFVSKTALNERLGNCGPMLPQAVRCIYCHSLRMKRLLKPEPYRKLMRVRRL